MTDTLERKPGAGTQIAAKASFARIRYAQVWEDADVLLKALDTGPGRTFVSICSAGDNALALLTLDPERVVAVDLSAAQLSCLRLRMAAYASLDHEEFLALMGARPSNDRAALLERLMAHLDETRPEFISFGVDDLPAWQTARFRRRGLPVLCWTVRDAATARRARRYADQITFENIDPARLAP